MLRMDLDSVDRPLRLRADWTRNEHMPRPDYKVIARVPKRRERPDPLQRHTQAAGLATTGATPWNAAASAFRSSISVLPRAILTPPACAAVSPSATALRTLPRMANAARSATTACGDTRPVIASIVPSDACAFLRSGTT